MGTYTSIRTTITNNVFQNTSGAVTGAVLQNVLLAMADVFDDIDSRINTTNQTVTNGLNAVSASLDTLTNTLKSLYMTVGIGLVSTFTDNVSFEGVTDYPVFFNDAFFKNSEQLEVEAGKVIWIIPKVDGVEYTDCSAIYNLILPTATIADNSIMALPWRIIGVATLNVDATAAGEWNSAGSSIHATTPTITTLTNLGLSPNEETSFAKVIQVVVEETIA